jgi:sucrose phosphorylase
MADVVVNHVSDQSPAYRDWLQLGRSSTYDGMFLTFGRVFPAGATEADLGRIHRPRAGLPFTRVRCGDGEVRTVWTTFTPQQIDLDVEHPATQAYLDDVLDTLAAAGVSMVRLDAVGYCVKRAGTSCFLLPETDAFVDALVVRCRERGLQVLVEVHGHVDDQRAIADRVDLVYDFALPPLVLDALYRGDATILRRWLAVRPPNVISVLDTHDGIGVIDAGPDPRAPERAGLLDAGQVGALADEIVRRTGGTAIVRRTGAGPLDLYQVDATFYDALGRDDTRYLVARLIQLLLPGIPQVYYVGLLAGTNDTALAERTGVPRDLNRHHYDPAEVDAALGRPVVGDLLELLRWRASSAVFAGTFEVLDAAPHELRLRWSVPGADDTLDASVDVAAATFELTHRRLGRTHVACTPSEVATL